MAIAARMDQSNIWWVFLLEGVAALIFGALLLTGYMMAERGACF